MSEATIRKFTDEGIDQFRSYLAQLREGSTSPPPFHILNDPTTSEPIDDEVQIENRNFETRLDLARYLDFTLANIENDSIETDIHLWSWLSLFYFDLACPPQKDGIRRPGRDYRHILEPGYPNGHRHLLCSPYMVYSVYELGEDLSKLLLCTAIPIESQFLHEFASRQNFITNQGLLEAAHLLYFEETTRKPKRGVFMRKNNPGTLYRFVDVIQQFDLNYDLYSMSGNEILDLLPPEFNKWKGQRPIF
jgi:hypothetical protein